MNLIRDPLIVHHMAALDGSPYPQNSLEAIQACLESGAAFIEIDVTALAADDYLLVHDSLLEHETNGVGEVGSASPEATRNLLIKTRAGVVTSYHPPLLSEVVALFGQYPGQTRLQIDFKNVFPMADDEPLQRFIKLIEPLGSRVLVSSGADWQLRWMHKNAPWLDLGFDIGFYLDYSTESRDPRVPPYVLGAYGYYDDHVLARQKWLSTAQYLAERCEIMRLMTPGMSVWYVDHHLLTHALSEGFNMAEWLHQANIRLDAWTLDVGRVTDENLLQLREAGIDQFTTNTPTALTNLFNAR